MVGWSGSKKAFTILAFILPTIIGILIFNVYPMILTTYTSFTERNKFKPNPNCDAGWNSFMVPNCWSMFRDTAPTGLGKPYELAEPIYANYATLLGGLFTKEALVALLIIIVALLPLYVANQIDKRLDKQMERKIPSVVVWLGGITVSLLLSVFLGILQQWETLMATGDFFNVVAKSFMFVILRVPISFAIGLMFAVILNLPGIPGRSFFRLALFIPWAASSVAILMSLIWQFFFREQGTVNQLLAIVGIEGQVWLRQPTSAFGIIVLADSWYSYGFFMVSIMGALTSISMELYEAAEVDGGGFWVQLQKITLPLIRPAVLPAAVLTSITAFQQFGVPWAITQGGPVQSVGDPGATELVMVYAYKQVFQSQNYGTATAFAVILFIFLLVVTLWSLRYTRITRGAFES